MSAPPRLPSYLPFFRFTSRAVIVFGCLSIPLAWFVVPRIDRQISCTVSPAFTLRSPIALSCNRPFVLTHLNHQDANIELASNKVRVISPLIAWSNSDTLEVTLRDPATSSSHELTFPITLAPASTQPSSSIFDGLRYFYSLRTDQNKPNSTSIWRFDPLTNQETKLVPAPQDKTIVDVIPSIDPHIYTWIEESADKRRTLAYHDINDSIQRSELLINDQTVSFDEAVFAPDAHSLITLDRSHNAATVIDTIDNYAIITSPLLTEKIESVSWTGPDQDVATLHTSTTIWTLNGVKWTKTH